MVAAFHISSNISYENLALSLTMAYKVLYSSSYYPFEMVAINWMERTITKRVDAFLRLKY